MTNYDAGDLIAGIFVAMVVLLACKVSVDSYTDYKQEKFLKCWNSDTNIVSFKSKIGRRIFKNGQIWETPSGAYVQFPGELCKIVNVESK